jgi:hypothetical protein
LISTVMRQAWALAVAEPLVLIFLVALLTVPYVMIEYFVPKEGILGAAVLLSLFTLMLQIAAMHRVLVMQGWIESRREAGGGFYSRAFSQSLVSAIVMIAGLLLLVLPGLFLFVRWSLSLPILLTRDCGIIVSLRESWKLTSDYFWPISGALLLSYLPFICTILTMSLVPDFTSTLWGLTLSEMATSVSIASGLYVQIAFYRHIKNVTDLRP